MKTQKLIVKTQIELLKKKSKNKIVIKLKNSIFNQKNNFWQKSFVKNTLTTDEMYSRQPFVTLQCFACVSWCLEHLYTNMTEPTESMWLFRKKLFFLKYIPHIWQCICFNVVSRINSYIYPVGFVMFVEWSPRHQETHAKKH